MNSQTVVEVAVVAPIDKTLSYTVPEGLQQSVRIGSRVKVPLGRRHVVGYVMVLGTSGDVPLKDIIEVIDTEPLFHDRHAGFYLRSASYYDYPPGEAVRTALPAGLSSPDSAPAVVTDKLYRAIDRDGHPTGRKQQEIFEYVRSRKEVSLSQLRDLFPTPYAPLQRLVELGFLAIETIQQYRDPFVSIPVEEYQDVHLNTAQREAVSAVDEALLSKQFHPFLLFGVTGSGKTEVYLQAIAKTLDIGRQALVLVPEIALTPQLVSRFRGRFQHADVKLAVLHSGLSDGERYDAWRQIVNGDVDVVIGARSAVFAPLPELGLVVVDEEHDSSYKQTEGFRYNARDLAQLRGQMENAVVLMGSATPAISTFSRAQSGILTRLDLPKRTSERPMPGVELVDLSQDDSDGFLSVALKEALAETVSAGEQALLLLNRRGYSPFLLCQDCGATPRCPNCDITLTFSQVARILRCHYCDFQVPPPEACEQCQGPQVLPEGIGTERLEEEVRSVLPQARIARMDRDTMRRKGAHQRLVSRMAAGEIDVLIGTQMIAKGHDFPGVTLAGVLNADTALNLPDFRSAERVFSLLSQVAGRAGRGDRPGRVIIQTYATDNYALKFVINHDYLGFAELELPQRQALDYPPYGYLVNLVLSGNDEKKVVTVADSLAAQLDNTNYNVEVLGPAPCLLARLRNKHRRQILLKAKKREMLRYQVARLKQLKSLIPSGVQLIVDVDPMDMF